MVVYVADIHAPDLVPSRALERHLFLLFRTPLRLLETVEPTVYSEDPAAGARAEVDSYLLQRRRDAELSKLGVLLQLPYLVHRPKVHLARAPARLVLESRHTLEVPLPQRPVDRGVVGFQVAGDALHVPALGVQRHDGKPTLCGARDLMVGRKAPEHPYGRGISFESPTHRPAVR